MKKIKLVAGLIAAFMTVGAGMMQVMAEEDLGSILRLDFDGEDIKTGYQFGTMNTANYYAVGDDRLDLIENANGTIIVNTTNFPSISGKNAAPGLCVPSFENFGNATAVKDGCINVGNYSELVMRTRFKIDGNTTDNISSEQTLWGLIDGHVNTNAVIFAYNGKLAYGCSGNTFRASNAVVKTEYPLKKGTWYTFEMVFKGGKVYVNVIPDEGEAFYGEEPIKTGFGTVRNIGQVIWWIPAQMTGEIDYIEIKNEGFRLKNTSIVDGAENVSADTGFSAEFSENVIAATLNDITVVDSDENIVPVEITTSGNVADIFFPAGLKYEEEYTITLPNTITNENNEKIQEHKLSFITEEKTFKTGSLKTSISGEDCITSVEIVNNSATDRVISILTVVYDKDNKVVKMSDEKITVEKGENGVKTSTVNVSGIENPTVKAYLWDGLNLE